MKNSLHILHDGIIERIEGKRIFVRISNKTACSSCHIKDTCGILDKKDKIIEVFNTETSHVVGEKVQVSVSQSLGFFAILLAYIVPFILILITLLTGLFFIKRESIAGILSILILVPYYLVLYLVRDYLKKKVILRLVE